MTTSRIPAVAVLLLVIGITAFASLDRFGALRERVFSRQVAGGPEADLAIEGASAGPSAGSVALPVEAGSVAPPVPPDGLSVSEPETAPGLVPEFDVVRVEADGSAVIAGRAAPGATVRILVDTEAVSTATADATGNFVAFLSLGLSDRPRVLTLSTGEVVSDASVIVQPVTAVAMADERTGDGGEAQPRGAVIASETGGPPTSEGDASEVAETPLAETSAGHSVASDVVGDIATGDIVDAAQGSQVRSAASNLTGEAGEGDGAEAPEAAGPRAVAGSSGSAAADATEPAGTDAGATGVRDEEPDRAEVARSEDDDEPALSAAGPEAEGATTTAADDNVAEDVGPELSVAGVSDVPTEFGANGTFATVPGAAPDESAPTGPAIAGIAEDQRPRSAAAPRVLLADATGVRVVQDGGAAPSVSSVSIDAISYDSEGEVALSGRATGDGAVRVYLDNRPLLTADAGETGQWRAELPEIDTGTYTLRVDELDATGAVVSRSETPFRREPVEAIRALVPDTPQTSPVQLLTVQPGNTLWGIAEGRYGDGFLYVRVFEANAGRIRNPDLIYPGQIFALPE